MTDTLLTSFQACPGGIANSQFSCFSLSQISVFLTFPFPFPPQCFLGCPSLCVQGFIWFPVPGTLHSSLFFLSQTVQFHIPGRQCPFPCPQTLTCLYNNPLAWFKLHLVVTARASPSTPSCLLLGVLQLWVLLGASLSLSGCQHLKGNEEEEKRWDGSVVEQECASCCCHPIVWTVNNFGDAWIWSYAKQLVHPSTLALPFPFPHS